MKETPPNQPLRVLVVDDSEDDAELLLAELRRGGFEPVSHRVADAASMRTALADEAWDVIISDWTIPGFGALQALAIAQEVGFDRPFITVSGTIAEEQAVAAMRHGAHDFVLKDRLARLVPAVRRELSEARMRAERRVMQEQLRVSQESLTRSEKLRALGQMAAGISHDLRNMLNPLSLHVQFLRRALSRGDTDEARESVKEMEQLVRRGVETLERLRAFSRKDLEGKPSPVDVNRITHEATAIAKPRMTSGRSHLRPIVEELGDPPMILARSGELVSAIVNLVVNAIDAIREGGTVTIRTRREGAGALIEVSDTGPGMTPEVAKRALEPFFTTKGAEGTGLGLPMVQSCVESHGGTLVLTTAPGQGTTFALWFPAQDGEKSGG